MLFAVLDVGGTSIKLGAVRDADVVVGEPVPALARSGADVVLDQLALAVRRSLHAVDALSTDPIDGLTIAFPGPFDLDAGRPLLVGQQKFDAIHGLDLRAELRARVDLGAMPIVFVRDSEAIGVGEAVFGAGQGARRVLTVALGTGFGSCLTDAGRVVEQVGSQRVERLYDLTTPDGRVDDVLSGRGFAELGADERAGAAFGRRLGRFLNDIGPALDVDLVVVAGGAAASFDRFASALASTTAVRCVAARLGPAGALLGTARLGQARSDVTDSDVPMSAAE